MDIGGQLADGRRLTLRRVLHEPRRAGPGRAATAAAAAGGSGRRRGNQTTARAGDVYGRSTTVDVAGAFNDGHSFIG